MKSVLFGVLAGLVAASSFSAFGLESDKVSNNRSGQERLSHPMYEVVDTYQGCDVIRYTDKFKYVYYFSHCKTEQ